MKYDLILQDKGKEDKGKEEKKKEGMTNHGRVYTYPWFTIARTKAKRHTIPLLPHNTNIVPPIFSLEFFTWSCQDLTPLNLVIANIDNDELKHKCGV